MRVNHDPRQELAPTLRVSLLDSGRSALVLVAGELDLATSGLLQAVLDDVLRARRTPRVGRLVLDMGGVTFVDVAGLSPILHARAVLARRDGLLEIREPTLPLRRVLRVLALDDLLGVPIVAVTDPRPRARPARAERRTSASVTPVRLVIARCSVDYVGRLTAHLPLSTRLILVKADGSVSIHADDRAYKPLNWMSPPCTLREEDGVWRVVNKAGEQLVISIEEVLHDSSHDLGVDPGLTKDGVEAHLQELLAERLGTLGTGWRLVRREYPTAIGPVDILCRDDEGRTVAVEIKRRGEIDGVEQLTRYLELLNRDPHLAPVRGVFAAQEIKPQARVLASDRGIACVTLDYDELRGVEDPSLKLF